MGGAKYSSHTYAIHWHRVVIANRTEGPGASVSSTSVSERSGVIPGSLLEMLWISMCSTAGWRTRSTQIWRTWREVATLPVDQEFNLPTVAVGERVQYLERLWHHSWGVYCSSRSEKQILWAGHPFLRGKLVFLSLVWLWMIPELAKRNLNWHHVVQERWREPTFFCRPNLSSFCRGLGWVSFRETLRSLTSASWSWSCMCNWWVRLSDRCLHNLVNWCVRSSFVGDPDQLRPQAMGTTGQDSLHVRGVWV